MKMKRNNGMKKPTSALLALMCILMCSLPLVSCHDPFTDDFGGVNYSDELKDTDTNKNVPQTEEETTEQLPETTEQPPETTEKSGEDDKFSGYTAEVFDEEGLYEFDPISGEKKLVFETEGMLFNLNGPIAGINRDGKFFYVLEEEYDTSPTIRVADMKTGERQVYEDVYLDLWGSQQWISPELIYISMIRGGFALIDIGNEKHTHYINGLFEIEMERGRFVHTYENSRIHYPDDYNAKLYYDGEVIFTHEVNRTYIDSIYAYGSDIILKVRFQPYIDEGAEYTDPERSFIVRGNIGDDGKFNVIYNCEVDNSLINDRMYFTEDGELCLIETRNVNEGDTVKQIFESYEYDSEGNTFVKTERASVEGLYEDYRTGPSVLPYDYPEASPAHEPMSPEEIEKMINASEEIKKILPDYFGEKAFVYSLFKKEAE